MKTATVFLVTVAVFTSLLLESSAAPAELDWKALAGVVQKIGSTTEGLVDGVKATLGGVVDNVKDALEDTLKSLEAKKDSELENSIKVDKKIKKFVTKSIEDIYDTLTELLEADKDGLAKTAGVEKEVLSKILKRLQNFDNIIHVLYTALKSAVASGNPIYIKVVVAILSIANEKTKKDQAEIIQTLKETPGEIVDNFEMDVKKLVDFIVVTTEDVVYKLKEFLTRGGQTRIEK